MTVTQRGLRGKTDTVSIECVCAFIPRMRVHQSVIDVHFCQFARLPNAIKADKLPRCRTSTASPCTRRCQFWQGSEWSVVQLKRLMQFLRPQAAAPHVVVFAQEAAEWAPPEGLSQRQPEHAPLASQQVVHVQVVVDVDNQVHRMVFVFFMAVYLSHSLSLFLSLSRSLARCYERLRAEADVNSRYPSPPRSLVRDGQTSPHRPRLVISRSKCPSLFPPPPSRTAL